MPEKPDAPAAFPPAGDERAAKDAPRHRWVLTVLALQVAWMIGCERWRDASPLGLAAFLVLAWLPLAVAFRAVLPPGPRATALLAGALVLTSAALDLLHPYPYRFTFPVWEAGRVAALFAASRLALFLEAHGGAPSARVLGGLRGFAIAFVLLLPLGVAYVGIAGARDASGPADAALVLGFALDEEGRPRPQIVGRVEHAARLQKGGLAPRLVLSGGVEKGGRTEAGVMRALAVARGVPEEALVLDEDARSTIENFACAKPILARLGAKRVLLVTEPWHMTRSLLLARRHGLEVSPSPASSEIWRSPRHAGYWLFRDTVAYAGELLREPFASPGVCQAAACEGCRKF